MKLQKLVRNLVCLLAAALVLGSAHVALGAPIIETWSGHCSFKGFETSRNQTTGKFTKQTSDNSATMIMYIEQDGPPR